MAQPLISPSEVFTRTWHETKNALSRDIKESMGFVALALASFLLAITSFYIPESLRLALRIFDIVFLQIIGSSWISLRLTSQILAERQGKKFKAPPLMLLGSFLLVSILSGLAALGGGLVFVIPGIWLTIAFGFSTYVLIDEGRKGRQALARSAELVKGRWWATVARLLPAGLLVLILSMVVGSIIEGLIGLIAGYRPSALVSQVGFLNWTVLGPASTQIASGALQVINSLPLLISIPFLTHLMVTVYLELKRTR